MILPAADLLILSKGINKSAAGFILFQFYMKIFFIRDLCNTMTL